jgi:hypothetical protein
VRLAVVLLLFHDTANTGAAPVTMHTKRVSPGVAHVRFDGRSLDVPLADLGVADTADDRDVRRAIARHLEVSEERLRDHVLDRHATGNVTLRPEAVFG